MHGALAQLDDRLLEVAAGAARGPKRNGVFALWMLVHVLEGALPPEPVNARAQRARWDALERRLSSLSLPPPLRRALTSAIRELADGAGPGAALQRLVAPARESLGAEVGEVLSQAARIAREAVARHGSPV